MRYVALLRGINVGGNTMVKMEELRRSFEALGFDHVKSYINSGNLAFDVVVGGSVTQVSTGPTSQVASKLGSQIEVAIEKDFGKVVPVMIRERKDIERILAANPFDGQYASHKEMHVLFLKEEMAKEKRDQLISAAKLPERFEVRGREIYCHLPMGVANSLLGSSFIENKLKVAVTGRNWRTVEKLAEL